MARLLSSLKEFAEVVSSGVKGMQRAFQDGLEEKCQVGADAVREFEGICALGF